MMTVPQIEPISAQAARGIDAAQAATSQMSWSDLMPQADMAERIGNPAAIGDQIITGLRDLLAQSAHINNTLGQDFQRALSRVQAREAAAAIGAPGLTGLVAPPGADPAHGVFSTAGLGRLGGSGRGGGLAGLSALPGPAELHPGAGLSQGLQMQWEKLRDEQDRAFIRYNEFAAYELQSSELQKITEQLSQAVNTLVRSS